jgi:amino acid adenylation domain-containing protein
MNMQELFVHNWFKKNARDFPDRPAIEWGNLTVTYRELDYQSDLIAAELMESGARTGETVAIATGRRVEMVTGIIGTLKAGCAFVPLPEELPNERLALLMEEASPAWLLVGQHGRDRIGRLANHNDSCAKEIDLTWRPMQENRGTRAAEWDPDGFCYIFFTSGSSGRPKGVAGRLKSIDHFIRWEIENFGLSGETRVSQLTSPGFDAFLRDIFTPLCSGGTICVPPDPSIVSDAERLVDWLDQTCINVVHTVPSIFRSALEYVGRTDQFSHLTHVFLAGESIFPQDMEKWFSAMGDRISIVNLYGPTETTMTKFFYPIRHSDVQRKSIPIGKPMRGARALVLNEKGEICPRGTVGEIYIRTPFSSLGYYRRPQESSQVFVQNPFTTEEDLVYRTGDLGRVLESGDFEFLGRLDRQVKIRGMRIELAEIESVLLAHKDVRNAAVAIQENGPEKRLVAYVVHHSGLSGDSHALRRYLLDKLPEYMVPTAWVSLDRLPTLPNGKLNRKGLHAPDWSSARPTGQRNEKTQMQELVAGVWENVLGISRVGAHENFFELGGHSLIATQVISRLRRLLNIELPLRSLFDSPTVAGLAERLELARSGGEKTDKWTISAQGDAKKWSLSYPQQRLWFLDRLSPGSAAYNVPCAVRLKGPLDVSIVERSFHEIVRRHKILRMRIDDTDGIQMQEIQETWHLNFEDVSERDDVETLALKIAREAAKRPFDLCRGPLFRVNLLRLNPTLHILLVNMHHIVTDGWSTGVLMGEFSSLYEAFRRGHESPLEELPLQYGDFANWQREWVSGKILDKDLSYWRKHLHADFKRL